MANVPDLSVKGWITNPLEKADKMMAHFYAAEFSQSNLFPKDVHSFVYLLQKNLNKPTDLQYGLEEVLTKYFNKYFQNTVVMVTVEDDAGSATKQTVTISLTFETSDGKKFDLTEISSVEGSIFERYVHLNNTGEYKSLDGKN